jgi:hypothetical protein
LVRLASLGILRLARTYGSQRLEAACQRGNDIDANYGSIASMLKHEFDKAYAVERTPEAAPIWHGNIRGGGYYHWIRPFREDPRRQGAWRRRAG